MVGLLHIYTTTATRGLLPPNETSHFTTTATADKIPSPQVVVHIRTIGYKDGSVASPISHGFVLALSSRHSFCPTYISRLLLRSL